MLLDRNVISDAKQAKRFMLSSVTAKEKCTFETLILKKIKVKYINRRLPRVFSTKRCEGMSRI